MSVPARDAAGRLQIGLVGARGYVGSELIRLVATHPVFELNERAGYVLGMDVGISKATVVVSDLRGKALGRSSQPFAGAEITAEERVAVVDRTAMMALHSVGASPDSVLAVCAGIAATVDRNGDVLVTQHFWGLFDVGLKAALRDLRGWTVLLENDANLAALGDRWRGAAAGVDDVVVILASERLGSGVIGYTLQYLRMDSQPHASTITPP